MTGTDELDGRGARAREMGQGVVPQAVAEAGGEGPGDDRERGAARANGPPRDRKQEQRDRQERGPPEGGGVGGNRIPAAATEQRVGAPGDARPGHEQDAPRIGGRPPRGGQGHEAHPGPARCRPTLRRRGRSPDHRPPTIIVTCVAAKRTRAPVPGGQTQVGERESGGVDEQGQGARPGTGAPRGTGMGGRLGVGAPPHDKGQDCGAGGEAKPGERRGVDRARAEGAARQRIELLAKARRARSALQSHGGSEGLRGHTIPPSTTDYSVKYR